MVRQLPALAAWCTFLCWLANPGFSFDAAAAPDGVVRTAIIPDAFPRYFYTWRMSAGGTYREDGRDALKGTPMQSTLSGRWSLEGERMILRQDGQPFVFDGVVLGDTYTATLYLDGHSYSRFCAARGEKAPERCGTGPGLAMTARDRLGNESDVSDRSTVHALAAKPGHSTSIVL